MKTPLVFDNYLDLLIFFLSLALKKGHACVLGRPRNGKTELALQAFRPDHERIKGPEDNRLQVAWLQGRTRPAELYVKLYKARDKPIILCNDLELRNYLTGTLFRDLLEIRDNRWVHWETRKPIIDADTGEEIPHAFQTSARVIIIANEIPSRAVVWQAVLGRTDIATYQPSLWNQFDYARTWCDNTVVLDELERLITEHPDAVAINLSSVASAAQWQVLGTAKQDGTPFWREIIRGALEFDKEMGHVPLEDDEERLFVKWSTAHGYGIAQPISRLTQMMGWSVHRLAVALDALITKGLAEECEPPVSTGQRRRPAKTGFRLVPPA